jgi:hypothetical protein
MNVKLPPAVFFVIVGLVVAVAGVLLYRQATEPIYKRDPDEQKFTSPSSRQNPQSVPPQFRGQMEEQRRRTEAAKEKAKQEGSASKKE